MNRRGFVFAGLAAAGTLAGPRTAVQAAAKTPARLIPASERPVFGVMVDQRFEAARSLANTAAWRGNRIFAYDGDLTAVWLHEIEPHWSRRAGALAGMTTSTALFCLEQLAAQHWLRVVTRIEQREGASEPLISWIIA